MWVKNHATHMATTVDRPAARTGPRSGPAGVWAIQGLLLERVAVEIEAV